MFKCSVCQKIYNTKVQYCDCGNDEFEEIPATKDSKSYAVNAQQLISWLIFGICIIISAWIWFGTDSPKPNHKPLPKKEVQNSQYIPSIDNIWDSTPAYNK